MITRRNFLIASATAVASGCVSHAFDAAATTRSAEMLKRRIPSTGDEIPVIGLGTWKAMNVQPVNEQTLAPRMQVLQNFYDAGGRLVDTAPSYENAEEVLGVVMSQTKLGDKLFIATKVMEQGEQEGEESFRRSLQRLRRDRLELMQCHNYTDWPTQLKLMKKWKDAGTFRYVGVTHFQDRAHEDLEQIIKRDKPDFLQINYSLEEPHASDRLLPVAKNTGVAVLINRPFAAGGLLRKLQSKPLPDFVTPFAASWPQACLKFVLANDAVTAVLPATKNPDHMRDNAEAGFGRLPDAEECRRLFAAVRS